jgi:hypothetical protein
MLALLAALATGMADDRALGRLTSQIALTYFRNAKCLAVVTEGDSSIADHMQPLNITTFHVRLPRDFMKSERLTPGQYAQTSTRPSIHSDE